MASALLDLSGVDYATMEGDVLLWKAVLEEQPPAHPAELLDALGALRDFGPLPERLLQDTKIGLIVGGLARDAAASEDVRRCARELVQDWRVMHRKRKADELPGRVGISGSLPAQRGAPVRRSSSGPEPFVVDTIGDRTAVRRPPPAAPPAAASAALVADRLRRQRSSLSTASLASSSLSLDNGAGEASEAARGKVRDKILEALQKAEVIQKSDGDLGAKPLRDAAGLAAQIESALHTQLRRNGTDSDYKSQARSIIFNLKDQSNPMFGYKVISGTLKPKDLPSLTAEEMASDTRNAERARMRKEAAEARESDWALRHGQMRITGMFTCGKCKGNKTTYYQMQTRSSDEPMTTFVTCLTCKNRWKFC